MLICLVVFWYWFRAHAPRHQHQGDRLEREIRLLSGVSITRVNLITYGLSGLFAAVAALYLTTQTGSNT